MKPWTKEAKRKQAELFAKLDGEERAHARRVDMELYMENIIREKQHVDPSHGRRDEEALISCAVRR